MRMDDGGEFWKEIGTMFAKVAVVAAAVAVVAAVAVGTGGIGAVVMAAGGTAAMATAATGAVVTVGTAAAVTAGSAMVGVGMAAVAENYVLSKNQDPYARPGQKKQGRERKEKKRKNGSYSGKNGKRRISPPNKHTPGNDHRKYKPKTMSGQTAMYYNFSLKMYIYY